MRTIQLICLTWWLASGLQANAQENATLELGCRYWGFRPLRECGKPTLLSRPPSFYRLGLDAPWQRIGNFGGWIKVPMQMKPAALPEFHRFQANRGVSFAFGVGTLVSTIAFLTTSVRYVLTDHRHSNRLTWSANPLFWLGAEFGCSFGAIVFRKKASGHLHQAVNLYNAN